MGYVSEISMPSDVVVVVARVFDAPLDKVYKAYTDPKLIAQWWGPRRFTTVIEKNEMHAGGEWRFIQKDREGKEFAFRGLNLEITPMKRISQTFEFEPMPGHIIVQSAVFGDMGGKTKVTAVAIFASREDRDGMLQSNMLSGWTEGYDRLDELLAKMQ